MLALQYRLDNGENDGFSLREVNQLFIHINNALSEHNIKETLIAIPDTCSIASLDIYALKSIRDMINKLIEREESLTNDNREPS